MSDVLHKKVFADLDISAAQLEASSVLGDVWGLFRNTFSNSADEFAEALKTCFQEHSQYYELRSLESGVGTLEALELQDEAEALADIYFAGFNPQKTVLDGHFIEGEVRPEFLSRARDKASFSDELSPREALEAIDSYLGWNQKHIDRLNSMGQDEWEALFTKLDGADDFGRLAKKAVDLRLQERYRDVGNNAVAALKDLANAYFSENEKLVLS